MNLRVFCLLPLIITLISCNTKEKNSPDQQTNMQIIDPHSFAKTNEAVVKHLSWKAKIDFDTKVISAVATWTIENKSNSGQVIFDTRDLIIENIMVDGNTSSDYKLADTIAGQSFLGSALIVDIPTSAKTVSITYKTSEGAAALQWLNAEQTRDKKFPFLFTQSLSGWAGCAIYI